MNQALIWTVAEAIALLEGRCAYLVVPLEIVPPLWRVVSLDGEFEAVLSDAELIQHAQAERAGGPRGSSKATVGQASGVGGGIA